MDECKEEKVIAAGLKVSIITVVLNAVATIEKAIKSVLDQSYENVEYIIIDGMSSDGTQDVINKYIGSIACYVREKDAGIYDAMNKGIKKASGDLIGILNADDWYEKDAVANAVSYIEKNENCEVVAGQIREWKDGETTCISNCYSMDVIWKHMPFPHPASFIRKEVYDRYGGYDTSYRICADYDFIFKLYVNHVRFEMKEEVWANFRHGGVSTADYVRTAKESNRIRLYYGEKHPELIDYVTLVKTCDRELDYAYLLEGYYHCSDQLVQLLSENFPEGLRVYGCGIWGRLIVDFCVRNGIGVHGLFDQNKNLWDLTYQGIRIEKPHTALRTMQDRMLIAVMYEGQEIRENLFGSQNKDIITLDELAGGMRIRIEKQRSDN